jgi:predicted ATP-binding protein involved in virulence
MAFYLEKAIFINRAPFEHLELDFKEKGVNVLSAVNGRGKTTILSHIVDAFYELARPNFENEFADKFTQYYRVSSPVFNIKMNTSSFVYMRFKKDAEIWDYVDIRNKCTEDEYNSNILLNNKIPFSELSQILNNNNNIKKWCKLARKEQVVKLFGTNLLTYFPSYRYEEPGFLNEPYSFKIEHKIESGFSGYLPNRIEVFCQFKELANWILDVILDNLQQVQKMNSLSRELQPYIQTKDDKTTIVSNQITARIIQEIFVLNNYSQQNIIANVNQVFTHALSSKYPQKNLSLNVGERIQGGTRINVVDSQNEDIIYPSIFNMSSGEKALISVFVELLHQIDNLHIQISNITGIVLIDEIDKNLHIKMQYEILPKLFAMFPNIQFITSSHSPFLNMGLADEIKEKSQIVDLDNNGIICSPVNTDLYREVYALMVSENQRFADKYIKLKDELSKINKPIIITEGKTDIKHILKAKEKLGITDIDFDTIECEYQPDGDSNLITLLEQLGKVARNNKVIGIFDRDKEVTIKKIECNGQKVKEYGHGVYAFCIPVPTKRQKNGQDKISIEYLYSDDEIKTILENGCRLFFGTEFTKHSLFHNTEPLTLALPKGKGEDKILENNGGQAVYDDDDNNHLAKKDEFAEAIRNDKISISNDSWNNYIPIFDIIRDILKR